MLSVAAGVSVSTIAGKYVFKNAAGEVILEANADAVDKAVREGKKVNDIPPRGFGDMMTPEETARYNKWWESKTWSIGKDGAIINGRKYTAHSLERMAPNTPEVRAILETRARTNAAAKGYKPGTAKYNDYINKYVQPRNIPPLVIEDAIANGTKVVGNKHGTWIYQTKDVNVIVNINGDVVTVIPK